MKIFTEKGLMEYIAKERYQEDLNRRFDMTLDKLNAELNELRWKVEALETTVRTPRTPVAVNTDNAVKMEVSDNGKD